MKPVLEDSVDVWASRIYDAVQRLGSSFVKSCVSTPQVIKQYIDIESGPVKNGKVNLTASNGHYFGPLQMGVVAWNDGPAEVSPLGKVKNASQLRMLTTPTPMSGGPSDITVMAEGIVRFWNKQAQYLLSTANRNRVTVRPSWNILYALHNQGAGGVLKYIKTGQLIGRQSDRAISVIRSI